MPKQPSADMHASIKPLLKRVGLDDKETEIYLTLLSLKAAPASDIAKQAKQSRTHAYVILRELEKKGLVSESRQNGSLQFVAEPPERLVSYLKDRETEYRELQSLVEGALPVLSSLTTSYVGAPRITVLKGLEGMKQVYRDILTQKFAGIYNAQTSLDAFGDNIVTMLFGKDAKLHGRDLIVQNEAATQYLRDLPSDSDYSIRLLPKDVSFDTDTIVYGDNVALFSYDDERTIIRIENRKIADSFRSWFEVMWAVSEKM
jgi:predicted transcriptional regulator